MVTQRIMIETERLMLRELCRTDHAYLELLLGNAEVMRYWPSAFDREQVMQWISKQVGRYHDDGCGYWLMLERNTNEPVGQAGVLYCDVEDERLPCLGYIVHTDHWRRRIATEAARGCLAFIFDELDHETAYAQIRPENEPSIGVARKLGMTEERRVQYMGFEHCVYALQRSEFERS